MANEYKVKLTKAIRYGGNRYEKNESVQIAEEHFEEFEMKGLVADFKKIELNNNQNNDLPEYEKITEKEIREKLDALGVDHTEAKDKKSAYELLTAQGGE